MLVDIKNKSNTRKRGFTIVELLIVVVIIAVLASISVIVYSGVKRQAVHASVQSEASQLETQLGLYNAENGDYPTEEEFFHNSEDCSSETDFCFDSEYKVEYDCDDWGICEYSVWADDIEDGKYGGIAGDTDPMDLTQPSDCPTNFISVPGSARYHQAGFCVMAYEAREGGGNTPVGVDKEDDGTPWSNISQSKAIEYSKNTCTGCHLITENEWMTIASDIAKVDDNWTETDDGSMMIYNGYNTGRNYYTLSNDERIYDLAGNYAEFTSGQVTGSNVACNPLLAFILCRYQDITDFGALSANMQPSSIGTEETKNSKATKYGFGWVIRPKNDTATKTRAVIRGDVGLLTVDIRFSPDDEFSSASAGHLNPDSYSDDEQLVGVDIVTSHVGFRVAKQ